MPQSPNPALPTPPPPVPGLLDLEIRRGPLSAEDRLAVLSEYNRLARARVSEAAFRRYLEDGPCGPGLHALLRTDAGKLVGHICCFPHPVFIGGKETLAAKAEYFFLGEAYRTCAIRGQEAQKQPPAILLLKAFYRQARLEGLDPILISAIPGVDFLHRMAGAKPVAFPLHECLFILRPLRASLATPNLSPLRRTLLFAAGTLQACLAVAFRLGFSLHAGAFEEVPVSRPWAPGYPGDLATFSWEPSFLQWRYPAESYLDLMSRGKRPWRFIAGRGGRTGYLRVCTTDLDSAQFPAGAFLASLLDRARKEGAMGVRWSIYDQGVVPAAAVGRLRKLGWLCVARTRQILIHTQNQTLLKAEAWQMEDSLIAFDD